MSEQNKNAQYYNPFMDTEEAARIAKSTPSSIYTMRSRGRIPSRLYVKFGSKVLYKRDEFIKWLLSGAKSEIKG